MLAFIKGYLLVSLICSVIFFLIVKYDCGEYDENDPRGFY